MTEKNLIEYTSPGEKEKKIGYKPNYDEMIEKSSCEEEAEAWRRVKNLPYEFAFACRFVGSYKNKCGHWVIIQHSLMTVRLLKDSTMNLLRNARKDFVQDVPSTLADKGNYHEREEKSSLFLLT